jgi:hypothetical protein
MRPDDSRRRPGFLAGLIDGMLGRRFWDPDVAAERKTGGYILGELWAVSTQPLALLAAMLDYEELRRAPVTRTRPEDCPR